MRQDMPVTILIVEDDHQVRIGTRLRLQSAGYKTIEAENGLEGVTMAMEHAPAVILLDVRMPTMDGLTALKLLQSDETTKSIPIIMLSASQIDQAEALDGGARYFLAKPYQGQQLLEAVGAVLLE